MDVALAAGELGALVHPHPLIHPRSALKPYGNIAQATSGAIKEMQKPTSPSAIAAVVQNGIDLARHELATR